MLILLSERYTWNALTFMLNLGYYLRESEFILHKVLEIS